MSDFGAFLESLAKQFPTKQAFAEAIGITPSRFSRVLAGTYTLNVLNCLRLAKATGRSPLVVLRAAGKDDIADLLESFYGHSGESASQKEREILDVWNALTPRAREGLRLTMQELPQSATRSPEQGKSRRRRGVG